MEEISLDDVKLMEGRGDTAVENYIITESQPTAVQDIIEGLSFDNCHFQNIEKPNISFINCKFNNCTFENFSPYVLNINLSEFILCEIKNSKWKKNSTAKIKIESTKFKTTSFIKGEWKELEIETSEFHNTLFDGIEFTKVTTLDVMFQNAVFEYCKMDQAYCGGSFLNTSFKSHYISHGTYIDTKFKGCTFETLSIHSAKFDISEIDKNIFKDTKIRNSNFTKCSMMENDFSKSLVANTTFEECNLSSSNFLEANINAKCSFKASTMEDVKMDNTSIYRMDNRGEITEGQRMFMKIRDDSVELLRSFSGFRQWIHLVAIIVWLSPYIFFLLKQSALSFLVSLGKITLPNIEYQTILGRLWEYIYTGGDLNGEVDILNLSLFFFMLLYNISRLILLYKAKTIEQNIKITSLPSTFIFSGGWKFLNKLNKVILLIALLAAAIHTFLFLLKEVPVIN